MECRSCGASIDYRAAFCSKCGELTHGGQPLGQKLGTGLAELTHDLGELAKWVIGYVRDEANRKQVIIGGVVIALLVVGTTENPISNGISNLFEYEDIEPRLTDEGLPDFANFSDVFLSEESEFLVMGTANVRDYPTSEGTKIINTIASDEIILARQVQAFDPASLWFKLNGGGYVWGGNLESRAQSAHESGASATRESDALGIHDLFGRWSDRATCYGEIRDIEFEVTINGLFMNGERHNIDGAPDGKRFTFSTNDPDPRRRSQIAVVKTETDGLLYVSFPDAMDLREFPFFPQGTSCAKRAEYLNQ